MKTEQSVLKTAQTDIEQLKQFSIPALLQSIQCQFSHTTGHELYYYSPFREERTASFAVNLVKNSFFDHGDPDKKGDVIKLAQLLWETDFKTTVDTLQLISQDPVIRNAEPEFVRNVRKTRADKAKIAIQCIGELTHEWMVRYLANRGIDIKLIRQHAPTLEKLKEVHYTMDGKLTKNGKPFVGVGWLNESGGYEIRSRDFKNCTSKCYTHIKGTKPGVAIFEGFLDYLAALQHYKQPLGYDVVILNSTSMLKAALPVLLQHQVWHEFLDNDEAGDKARAELKKICPEETEIVLHHDQYAGFKDFNDFLTGTPPTKKRRPKVELSELAKTAKWWFWVLFQDQVSDEYGKRDHTQIFYAWSNDEAGYNQLMALRDNKIYHSNWKCVRLMERAEAWPHKIIGEWWKDSKPANR